MSYPLAAMLISGGVWLAACGDTGAETRWQPSFLAACVSDSHCEAPLTCLRNLCTRSCTDDDGCDLADGASCDEVGRCVLPERAGCTRAAPCDEDHAGWTCDAVPVDACRTDVAVCRDGAWIDGALDTCRGALAETVPASDGVPETVHVERSESDKPVDVLFVVDRASAMVEQLRLAAEFPAFVAALSARGVGDIRIATTTSDVQCTAAQRPGQATRGAFVTQPANTVSFQTRVAVVMECREDADCATEACDVLGCTGAIWGCSAPQLESCVENPNGSWNSRCYLRCEVDADCTAALGSGYRCLIAAPGESGCVVAPAECPETIPAILEGDDLALAPCGFRGGLRSERCLSFEQPLEALRLALDPAGENAAQAAELVRPHALLAVVVVSDEDDCSVVPGGYIDGGEAARCGLYPTIDAGGPLETVAHYVDFLRAAKPPGRVFFAAIAGDSLATDPAQAERDRAAYRASKVGSPCTVGTSICTTSDGRENADYGARLFAAVDALAPDSHGGNLCSGDWAGLFDDLGAALAATATRICLPRAPSPGFVVERVVDGVATALVEAPAGAGTWRRAAAAPECPSGVAVVLADPPVAGERLRFAYGD